MQWLAGISVKRPVFASVLVLSLAVVGVFAYFRLGVVASEPSLEPELVAPLELVPLLDPGPPGPVAP